MPTDFPTNPLQNAWQDQPTEECKMSADQLRRKAEQLDRKARSSVLVAAAIAIVLFLCFGWAVLTFPEAFQTFNLGPVAAWTMRLGFAVLSLWSLFSGYKSYRVVWPSTERPDADLKTTLQSYREQLEKRRDYSRHIWLRSGLLFCFLGIAMVMLPLLLRYIATPQPLLVSIGPLFALLILWLAIFIPQRKRIQQKLQHEIDQLRAFEREYRA